MEHFFHFWYLEVLPVYLLREVKPFIIWFYPPLLDYDVSLHKVLELVVVIPTSPKSSKNRVRMLKLLPFSFWCFCQFWRAGKAGPGPEKAGPLALSSGATCQ
jgi:hypothetical protein